MAPSWQKCCPNCGNALLRGKFKLYRLSEFGRARPAYSCGECGSVIKYRIGWAFILATIVGILSVMIRISDIVPWPDGVWWVALTVALMAGALFFFIKPALVEAPE